MKYTLPKRNISPFYHNIKIPRKLKKKVKQYTHWKGLTNGQRLWEYMEKDNMEYKHFLISEIIKIDKYGKRN